MILKTQRILLFLILFFIISQLGKHFWPDFAYVSGIRVDYLSPTLYLTDILIFILFIISVPFLVRFFRTQKQKVSPWNMLFFSAIIISTLFALKVFAAIYGVLKILEFVFLGFMVSKLINNKDFKTISFIFSFAVLIEGGLVLWQFIEQSSIGGLWYLIGERSFSVGTIGISTVPVLGNQFLRAYGSFPHPNILAFFMLLSSLIFLIQAQKLRNGNNKYWFWTLFAISSLSLLLTFSRLSILLYLLSILLLGYKKVVSKRITWLVGAFSLLIVGFLLQRFSISSIIRDLSARYDLIEIAIAIFVDNPIFGVGILNHFYYQLPYQREITHLLLQPVHNIYLLILVQVGLLGFLPFIRFVYLSLKRVVNLIRNSKNQFKILSAVLALNLFVIGLADHYFITLQQGMIMTAFVLGLIWTKAESKESK